MRPEDYRSIYVHFPYCETKCHYCDFFSLPENRYGDDERRSIYDALIAEAQLVFGKNTVALGAPGAETIFFGGGTPSLAPIDVLERLIAELPIRTESIREFTLEANPSSVTIEKAVAWRRLGIERVSLGVQALDDNRLKWLGRVHSVDEIYDALEILKKANICRVNVDYILGVPDQTVELISSELSEFIKRFSFISHVSAYLLTLKPSNPRFASLPSEDEGLAHLRMAHQTLVAHGFEHYEVSNYARPGLRALHNENYWLHQSYCALGPSAHGYEASSGVRYKNVASLHLYAEKVGQGQRPWEWSETIDSTALETEFLMLRLRRSAGIDLGEFTLKFPHSRLFERCRNQLEHLAEQGLCLFSDGFFRLTSEGFFVSDSIIEMLASRIKN